MASDNKRLSSRLDRIAREIALEQAGYECQKCGSLEKLQWCHIVPRHGHKALQWSEENTIILCKDCHVWFDRKATDRQRVRFVERVHPIAYDWLEEEVHGTPRSQLKFNMTVKDMEALSVALTGRLARIREEAL